jgi:hypothetical protein
MKPGGTPLFVVVSGIPGSGKTTLGRKLAEALRLPFYDKDDILEGLFESGGIGDVTWRKKLSRQSDEELVRRVTASAGAVMVSFWQTEKTGQESGTPVDWIKQLSGRVLEIQCSCDPTLAARRFNERRRHAGHLDNLKPAANPTEFTRLASSGPLGVGEVTVVDTSGAFDIAALVTGIRAKMG